MLAATLIVLGVGASALAQSTVTIAPALPSNEPSYTKDDAFRSAVLNSTNFFRKQHGAQPLKWNESLVDFGADHAEECVFEHSGGPTGENLAEGYANVTASIDAWGNEREHYDYDDPGFSEETGHFTQLVWKNTTTVGCGRAWCNDEQWLLVCEYYPQGNIVSGSYFEDNVQKQVTEDGSNNSSDSEDVGGGSRSSDDCPQGADCSAATSIRPTWYSIGVLLVALSIGIVW